MNVLVIDEMTDETRASLEGLGLSVRYEPKLSAGELSDHIKEAHLLVTSKTRVTRRAIEASNKLQAILRAGVGVDIVDLAAASERGILVADCGSADINARAEFIMGLIIGLDRGLGVKEGQGLGLRGRTLGLHGWDASAPILGHIARAFGLRVLVYSSHLTPTLATEAGFYWAETAEALYRKSDIISLHPEVDATQPFATAKLIDLLHESATLVDVSGRGFSDLAALHARLSAGTLRVALDGYDANDYGDDVPFSADLGSNFLATYRQASKTRQMEEVVAHQAVSAIEQFIRSRTMPSTQNLRSECGESALVVRHHPGAEFIASVFSTLNEAKVSVCGVESQSFNGDKASLLRIRLNSGLSKEVLGDLRNLAGILGVEHEN